MFKVWQDCKFNDDELSDDDNQWEEKVGSCGCIACIRTYVRNSYSYAWIQYHIDQIIVLLMLIALINYACCQALVNNNAYTKRSELQPKTLL